MKTRIIIVSILIVAITIIYNLKSSILIYDSQTIEILKADIESPQLSFIQKKHRENNKLFGWLKIENTKIDYPVMYSGDDYYLDHNFDNNKDIYGSLFIDKYNKINPRDINLIIHGHDTFDDKMFGSLKKYKDYDYYLKHKLISFETLEHHHLYEIVSVFVSKVYYENEDTFKYYKFYDTNNSIQYDEFIQNIKKLQLYDTKVIPTFPDKLITLSTCDDTIKNGRLVIVAKETIFVE